MGRGEVRFRIVGDAKPFVDAAQQAQKELSKLTDSVTDNAGALGRIASAGGPAGLALAAIAGAATGVSLAMAAAVKGLVETGGHLADLEAKTSISTQALQKLAFAGSLVGVSEEEITGAAVKMEKALANNESVFGKLGLSVQKLRAMEPDQAFAAIATQIARIKDPAGQAAAAMEAFGKSGASLLPLMKSDIAAAAAEAEKLGIILSSKTVSAADALGDEATKLAAAWEGVKNQFAAAIVENPALLDGLHKIVDAMGQLSHWITSHKDEIGEWAGKAVTAVETIGRAMANVANSPSAQLFAKMMWTIWGKPIAAGINALAGEAPGPSAGSGTGHMAPGSSYAAIGTAKPGGLTFNGQAGDAKAEAEVKKRVAAIDKAMADYKHGYEQLENEINAFLVRSHALATHESQKYWNEQEKQASDYGKWYLDYLNFQQTAQANMANTWDGILQTMNAEAVANARAMGDAFNQLGDAVGGFGGNLAHFLGDGFNMLANLNDEAIQGESKWQKLAMAIQGAINAYGAGKQAGSAGKGALAGAGQGAMAGAAFGPWGAAIGAVAGGVLGFFGGKSAHNKELKDLNVQLAEVQDQAHKAGIQLQLAFNPKNAQSMKAAIDQVKHALDTQAEAHQKLQEAIDRYGFTIEQLGPAMQRQKLDEQAAQLYQDYQLLTASGIDYTTVLQQMGPALNDYIQTAVKAGQDIPEAMKPMIDKAIELGLITDENGNAYGSAEEAGIHYAKSMSEMFEQLISKLDEWISALNGIPTDKSTTVTVNRRVLTEPGSKPEEGEVPKLASGGRITRTGLAMLHAGEVVVPAAQASRGGAGHTVNVHIANVESGHSLSDITKAVERGAAQGLETALRRRGFAKV